MVVNIPGKLRLAFGSVKDHASIGKAMLYKYNNSDGFSDIEIAVVRATGHDHGSIDDQHMHEILFLVSNSPGSIPFLAERISRRLGKTRDPLVALKTLLLIHRLLRGGNRCFEQQLRKTYVSGHLQMSTSWWVPMKSSDPWISFLHKYASYLEERMSWVISQAGKLDPVMYQQDCLEFHCYEEKSIDMVFRKLPKCQVFIDKVLHCSPLLPSDSNLAQAAMINTLKESFQVYVTFCEGVAALVNMFFDLTRSARVLACEILKRASQQSLLLHNLFEECKRVMENKSLEYPSIQIIAMEHVLALEKCLGSSELNRRAPILNCLTKSTDLESAAMTSMKGKKDDQKKDVKLSTTTLFSCKLETKISEVWVVFEDEDYKTSPLQKTQEDIVYDREACYTSYVNPFLICTETVPVQRYDDEHRE